MKMVGLVLSVSSEEGGSCDVPVLMDIQAVDVKIQADCYGSSKGYSACFICNVVTLPRVFSVQECKTSC